jgi:hypothetical protein
MQNPSICPFLGHPAATRNITGIRWKPSAFRSVYRFRSTRSGVQPGEPLVGARRSGVYSFGAVVALRECADARTAPA